MKYLKLFEQLIDWDDPFGEEIMPHEEGELFIMKIEENDDDLYLGYKKNGRIYMFDYPTPIYDNEDWTIINPNTIDDNDIVSLFDKINKYDGDEKNLDLVEGWKDFRFYKLPKEIKDKL